MSILPNGEGIEVFDIKSNNDGDIVNFIVTHELISKIKNPVCLDIGADQGIWGLCIKHQNPDAHILFFEPNPYSYIKLQNKLMGMNNMNVFNIAISDKPGKLNLTFEGGNSNSRGNDGHIVECDIIDNFIKNYHHIDIVKIDTEGHDLKVLRGLLQFVKNARIGAIVTEFSTYWYGNTIEECVNNTYPVLLEYVRLYKYCYALSRRGDLYLVGPINQDNIITFICEHYERHLQTDLYFCNTELTTIHKYTYEPNKYYA